MASNLRPGPMPSEFRGSFLNLTLFTQDVLKYYKKRDLIASDLA